MWPRGCCRRRDFPGATARSPVLTVCLCARLLDAVGRSARVRGLSRSGELEGAGEGTSGDKSRPSSTSGTDSEDRGDGVFDVGAPGLGGASCAHGNLLPSGGAAVAGVDRGIDAAASESNASESFSSSSSSSKSRSSSTGASNDRNEPVWSPGVAWDIGDSVPSDLGVLTSDAVLRLSGLGGCDGLTTSGEEAGEGASS